MGKAIVVKLQQLWSSLGKISFFKSASGTELNANVYINIYSDSDVRGSGEMLRRAGPGTSGPFWLDSHKVLC